MFELSQETINGALKLANNVLSEVVPNFIVPNISSIKVTNASSYWANIGKDREKPSSYAMHISRTFEKIPNPDKAKTRFYSCMIHELIHTIPGCNNHGKKFKYMCSLVNAKYPEYKVQTSTSSEEYEVNRESKNPKYICHCKHCNAKYFYFRKPNYPISKYICKCGRSELELLPFTANNNK